jgi:hypothetical protein
MPRIVCGLFAVAFYAFNLACWIGAGLGFVAQLKGDGFQLWAFVITMGFIVGAIWTQALAQEMRMRARRRIF